MIGLLPNLLRTVHRGGSGACGLVAAWLRVCGGTGSGMVGISFAEGSLMATSKPAAPRVAFAGAISSPIH